MSLEHKTRAVFERLEADRRILLHLLGVDHERLTYRYSGRDFHLTHVAGKIIRPIQA